MTTETPEQQPEETFDAFDDTRLVPVTPLAYSALLEYGAIEYDPKPYMNVHIDFGELGEKKAVKADVSTMWLVPRWCAALFPYKTESEALTVLSADEWKAFFVLCLAEESYKEACASVLVLKGAPAFTRFVRGRLKADARGR